jgi:hypothetical protein
VAVSPEQAQAVREADAHELAKLTSGERAPYRVRRIDFDGTHFTASARFGDGEWRRVRRVAVGVADLGYAERASYSSVATLRETLRDLAVKQSSGLRLLETLSYDLHGYAETLERSELQSRIAAVVQRIFAAKHIAKSKAVEILGSDALATTVLNALREKGVIRVEGVKRSARWVFAESWVYHDHEVSGLV